MQPGTARRRRRRSRTAGRIRLVVLLSFIAAVVALIVVETSSGTRSSSSSAPGPGAGKPAIASSSKRKPTPRAAAHAPTAATLEAGEVRTVLSYTPFVRAGIPRHRVIALTFDDGPSPYTPRIVGELARLHVPGTFFVVGQQLDNFAAGVRDEVRHGFAIGDHTENHADLTQLSPAGQYRQIHDVAVRIERLGAPPPVLYRPPYGTYNSRTLATLKRVGMLMTLWSVDTRDWMRPGTAAIIRGALSAARPGGIILMHDGGGDRSETVAALPAIISALRRRHFSFVTVPQLLRLDPPPRNQQLPHVSE